MYAKLTGRPLAQLGRALGLPGSTQAVEELRLLLAADLFILTDDVAVEKVSNGIVTRAVKSWIADHEHLRQVELLPWVAKQLDGWDTFAPTPRGSPDSKQVRGRAAGATPCGASPEGNVRVEGRQGCPCWKDHSSGLILWLIHQCG